MSAKQIKTTTPGTWHQLVELFDPEEGIAPATVDDMPPMVVNGKLEDVPVITVPTSATAGQVRRIAEAVEEAIGKAPLVVTNNVKLLKLRPLSDKQARGIMDDAKKR
jgi:hypothetical protein